MNPNVVYSPKIKVDFELENDIKTIFVDTFKQVCRFNNTDVCKKVIRHVEYSEAEKKLSFNHAGLSEKSFPQVLLALQHVLKLDKVCTSIEELSFG